MTHDAPAIVVALPIGSRLFSSPRYLSSVALIASVVCATAARAQLVVGVETFRIGSASRARGPVFGDIVAAKRLGDGRIAIVDGRFNDIRVFNDRGILVQRAGGPGCEVGAFHVPVSATIAGQFFLVLDAATERVTGYKIRDSLELAWSDSLGHTGSDLCAIGRRLFVVGAGDSAVHEYSIRDDGLAYTRSFGQPFAADPALRVVLSAGRIACAASTIAVASVQLPFVWIYDLHGALVRRVHLPGFRSGLHRLSGERVTRTEAAPGGETNRIAALLAISPHVFALQIAAILSSASSPWQSLRTIAIRSDTVESLSLGTTRFRLCDVDDSFVLGTESLPYLTLRLRQRRAQ